MTNISRLLLSAALIGGSAMPAFAQGQASSAAAVTVPSTTAAAPTTPAAPKAVHHRVVRVHPASATHDVGATAKPAVVRTSAPAVAAPAAVKSN